jgi:hypothetical protein
MSRRDPWLVIFGAAVGTLVTWMLVHPEPGESFPVVFRGTTQGVTADGDGVAFHPIEDYRRVFGDVYPAFAVEGENRSGEHMATTCLAPGTAEQDVVFAVANTGTYQLVWYRCLTEGTVGH